MFKRFHNRQIVPDFTKTDASGTGRLCLVRCHHVKKAGPAQGWGGRPGSRGLTGTRAAPREVVGRQVLSGQLVKGI